VGRYEETALAYWNQDQASTMSVGRCLCSTLACVVLVIAACGSTLAAAQQLTVVTQHNDIGRTGQNNNEVTLTPGNVNSSQFGLLFSQPVDGQIYAQPLYLQGLQIPGAGSYNVVFVATENDSVYAFDADTNGGPAQGPLWHANLLSPAYGAATGATPVPSTEIADDIVPEYGITGTPVIDPVAGVLYVVSFTQEGTAYVLRLHALSVTTGAEMPNSPVTIHAQVAGVGNGSSGGVLNLDPRWENQRSGLLLLNGVLYVSFASHADNGDWHGWLLSYNPTTLAQLAAYTASPNGVGSGFWMSGDGLAADVIDPVGHPFGRLFLATGNGDYSGSTPYTNAKDYGDSILNLDLTNGIPTVQDEFTPFNQATLDSSDGDLGSGGLTVIPTQTGTYPDLLVQEGKAGTLYLVNRDAMSGYNATDNVVQEIDSSTAGHGVWGGPVYWNGYVYTDESYNRLKAYTLTNGVLAPSGVSPEKYNFPGPGMSISSSGTSNGILWAIESDSYNVSGNAVLRAYNATNVATEYYNSIQVPNRDAAGPAVKFAVPTVINGKVYVGTGNQLDVYGLLNELPSVAPPVITPGTSSFTGPIQVSITDATPGATIYYTTDGSGPSTASTVYLGPLTINTTQTVTAIAVAPGYDWITPVSATFTSLDNTPNPSMSPFGGTFTTLPTVTITDSNTSAAIYYTMDGSTPTNASTVYTAPITLTGTQTIKAIAFAPGLNGSAVDSQTYTTESGVNLSLGFAQAPAIMTFNGSTGLDDSRLQLTNGYTADTGSAFITYKLNIQAFTTQFQFQLSNPQADGITFTIQNSKPSAMGPYSEALGYASIPNSVAIKFDFFNDQGEGPDSTGLYINGVEPTIPALNLSTSGINLASGDLMAVTLNYDGTNLEMTITDQVTAATWSCVWQVNIPQIVGANIAYVGFTGSTQILTASQKIASWTYTALAPGQSSATAPPVIFPGTGNYVTAQTATLTSATQNAAIYYTTDGTVPTTTSNLYTAPFPVASTEVINAMAVGPTGVLSGMASATMEIASGVTNAVPAYSSTTGAFGYGQMILNGAALVSGTLTPAGRTLNTESLQLTDGSLAEIHSAFFANPVNVQAFTSDFDFQLPTAAAEGFTFVIQNAGLNAIGTCFGYGFGTGGTGTAIGNSVALAFDINGTAGQGANVALLYVNGNPSNTAAVNLGNSGIMLNSGHSIHAHLAYDGNNLTVLLTDNTNSDNLTLVYPIGIPAIVGGNTAYVGFTGATNATAGATQNIQDWTYAVATPAPPITAAPVVSPAGATFAGPTIVTITDGTPNAVIYYTTDGTAPTTASSVYGGPITVNSTATIQAVAQASGDLLSAVASAAYTIQAPVVTAVPVLSPAGGSYAAPTVVTITDATSAAIIYYTTNGSTPTTASPVYNGPITLNASATVKAVAQAPGDTLSGVAGASYNLTTANPVISFTGGNYVAPGSVTITDATPGAVIYYTTDGTSPTTASTPYSGPITLNASARVKAVAQAPGDRLSGGASASYTLTTATPVISFSGGKYVAPGAVTITDTTPGAVIYYTTDGTTPTTASTLYSGLITLNASARVKAVAQAPGDTLSGGASANYTLATATPVITPGTGTYATSNAVTIADATPGAVIYYTTNGSTPTAASTVYSGSITINVNATVKAIAQAPGDTLSGVASASYIMEAPAILYSPGFAATGLKLNGSATLNGTTLQLTSNAAYKAGSAYFLSPVNIQAFINDFTFQLPLPVSNGIAFVLQNQGLTALGADGGNLGYGSATAGAGIQQSMAIKFDDHNNSGEGIDSTGLYINGAAPTIPATDLTPTGLNLNSGNVFHAHMTYDGTTLIVTITDTVTAATATQSYVVNIPSIVGANTAYAGFTAGTGATFAQQNILTWNFNPQ
jgi:hypothetical protein